jgi:predicted Zn-dependent protease
MSAVLQAQILSSAESDKEVGAYMENNQAMIFINDIGEAADPEKLGKAFVAELQKKHNTTPESVRSDKIGNWPAYLVTFTDASARPPAHIYYLWVTIGKLTYQLIGAGPDQYKEKLRETVFSLRPLTTKERDSITGIRLRIATARAGEDLSELSWRSGNVWSPAYTAMINNISENVKLAEKQLVKIAREEPYRPGEN